METFCGRNRVVRRTLLNIANWIVTLITLAPGIGLLMLADKFQAKQKLQQLGKGEQWNTQYSSRST